MEPGVTRRVYRRQTDSQIDRAGAFDRRPAYPRSSAFDRRLAGPQGGVFDPAIGRDGAATSQQAAEPPGEHPERRSDSGP